MSKGLAFLSKLGSISDLGSENMWSEDVLRRQILNRAHYLSSNGVTSGDRVMVLHSNSKAFFADLFAIWLLGGCAVVTDPDIGKIEHERLASHANAKLSIIDGSLPPKLDGVEEAMTVVDTSEASRSPNKILKSALLNGFKSDDAALILYTSGSTGDPKGVVHTFRTLQAKWSTLEQYVPRDHCSTALCLLPTHFGHGLICNSLYPLVNGCHLVIAPKADVTVLSNLGTIISTYGITFMSSVPAMWRFVLRTSEAMKDGPLRQVHIGSAPLSQELWTDVQDWTGIRRVWNLYGITETGSWVAGTSEDQVKPMTGLVGTGWGSEILVSPYDNRTRPDTGPEIGALKSEKGEKGNVWLRTPSLMRGYLDNEALTQEAMSGDWFFTGDLGYIDDQDRLVLVGRTRNEINKAGMKISPEEVDVVLEQHPDILEVCTFGIEDPVLGEKVAAAVSLDRDGGNEPKAIELLKWCSLLIADYKVPSVWYQLDSIPKTSTGKVDRRQTAASCKQLRPIK